jgi:hypothetical protein
MAKRISDLINHIKSELQSAHDQKTLAKGTTKPTPVPPPADKDLGSADDNDLQTAVRHAISDTVPKWQTDDAVRAPLKVKGDKMVKSVMGLKRRK